MKIAFPTMENQGMNSIIHGHFGSAPAFILVDDQNNQVDVITNKDMHHAHGQCQPLAALDRQIVDAVVVGGIGGGALRKLNAAGITVYRAVEGTVADNLKLARDNKLPVFTLDQTCAGHTGIGGCVH